MLQSSCHKLAQLKFSRYFGVTSNVFGIHVPSSKPPKDTEQFEQDIKNLKWRTPYAEKKEEWYSKLKLFAPDDDTNASAITVLQQPIDLRLSSIKSWWIRKNMQRERFMQQFIPERHEILGNDLAAAHFLVHRGGAVRFCGSEEWTKQDKNDEYDLPKNFVPNMYIESIRCDNMELYYEGLENVRRLKHLKYLSFKNVATFDDWCLDRVSGSEFSQLETLDLSGTNITERGLQSLYRIPTLRTLILDEPARDKGMELVLSMLQEVCIHLKVVDSKTIQGSP